MELEPLLIIVCFQITLYMMSYGITQLITYLKIYHYLFYLNVRYHKYMHYLVSLMPDHRSWTDSKTIKFYKTLLDIKLKAIVFPVHLLSCTFPVTTTLLIIVFSLIVNACIIFLHQLLFNIKRKLRARETSLRVGIENLIMLEKVYYSGNGCGFNAINQFLVSCTV